MPNTSRHTTPEETQRFHGERVEARQRERADPSFFDHRVSLDETGHEFFTRMSAAAEKRAKIKYATDALFTAILLDIIAHGLGDEDGGAHGEGDGGTLLKTGDETGGEPAALTNAPKSNGERFPSTADLEARFATTSQDHIDPIDEANEPPFFQFWQKLNAELLSAGKPEATYGVAKTAFEGGETPKGSLTFIGKNWDGIRAVPSGDGGYHGEFREVSDEGTVWRVVAGLAGPSEFASAEGALYKARQAKQHSEDHQS